MLTENEQMRHEVAKWLNERPLLPQDLESLMLVVKNEEEELQFALAGGQQNNIELEAGDVLFSRIAAGLDTRLIEKLISTMNLHTSEVFKRTRFKNGTNYGRLFFQEVSPFDNAKDSITCLRLFRKVYETPENLDKFWEKVDHYINDEMAFYDKWWVAKRFRGYIKRSLRHLLKTGNIEISNTAELLLVHGYWDSVPFVIR